MKEDLLTVGESIKNKKAKATIAEISELLELWKKFTDDVGIDSKLRDEINNTLIRYR
jgi:serine/threonine-protein kinase HipA